MLWSSPYYFILLLSPPHHMSLAGTITKPLFSHDRSRTLAYSRATSTPLLTDIQKISISVKSLWRNARLVRKYLVYVNSRAFASTCGVRRGKCRARLFGGRRGATARGRSHARSIPSLAMKFSAEPLSTSGGTQVARASSPTLNDPSPNLGTHWK